MGDGYHLAADAIRENTRRYMASSQTRGVDTMARKQDDLLTWKMKVAAIWHVYQFGGRVTLIDADEVRWVVERKPDAVLKQIQGRLALEGVLVCL